MSPIRSILRYSGIHRSRVFTAGLVGSHAPGADALTASSTPLAGALRWTRAYVVQMRPYLLFVSGITGLCGMALTGTPDSARLLVLGLAFSLSYGFGQALTDCFQLDTDRLSAPYRPLVSGRLKRGHVLLASMAGLAAVAAVFAISNPRTLPLALLGAAGLATYTPFKRRWWAGPFYNAWIVAVLCLIGALSARPEAGYAVLRSPDTWLVLGAVFFAYAEFVLVGYFKDISADRASGYLTLPVRFGMRPAALVSDAFAALAVAAYLGALLAHSPLEYDHRISLVFAVASVFRYWVGHSRLRVLRDESQAFTAIVPGLHGYVLLLSAITVLYQPGWWVAIALYNLAFLRTLAGRPSIQQI